MRNMITFVHRLAAGKHAVKDQETLRREYEEAKYDHYLSYGSAFMNICSRDKNER